MVVKTPTAPALEAVVLTRSSGANAQGRPSAPLPDLGLRDSGKWQPKVYWVAARHFGTPYVEYLGALPEGQLVVVLDLWEKGK